MNRKELDEKILAAISTLQSKGKSLTVNNIKDSTGLLKYQIYTSKHKNQLEVRSRKIKAIQPVTDTLAADNFDKPISTNTQAVATSGEAKTAKLDLSFKLLESALKIDMREATANDIDAVIENLTFLFKKSIARLELEKSRLQK